MLDWVQESAPAGEVQTQIGIGAQDPAGERLAFSGSLRTRAARGTAINALFTVGLGCLGVLESFILARFVSRADYGVWGVLTVTLGTLVWLKQVGIGDKYVQQEDADQVLAFQRAFTLELALSAALVVVLVAAVPVIVAIYGLPQLVAPSAVLAVALLGSAFQAPQWIYYRRMDFARQRTLAAVDPVVGFGVAVALAAAGAGYWAFVGGLAAGACAASIAAVLRSPLPLRLRYERRTFRSYTSFSLPLLAASFASLIMTWSAMIATKLHLGVAALGVIALAATLAAFTQRVDEIVTGALYPAICAARKDVALLYESFIKTNRLALMWAIPFGVALTLFASDLIRFGIGERWRPALIVLEVYGLAAALNHVGFNWTAYFRAVGRTWPIAVANVTAMGVFLAAGIPMLLLFGLPGFAAGVALQGLAALILRTVYVRRLFPGYDFLRHMTRSFIPTLPAVAVVLLARALETGVRTVAVAIAELCTYTVLTVAATWLLESSLVREALAVLRAARVAPRAT